MQQQKKTSFQDVRDEVMRRIEARVWDQGALLPTEADLAEEFGCARATVNRALRELADRGIIDRKRKSGTRVATLPVKQAKLEIATTRRLVEERNATYRYALVSRQNTGCARVAQFTNEPACRHAGFAHGSDALRGRPALSF